MIQTPKQRLFRQHLFAFSLLLLLVGFFVYAMRLDQDFFFFLSTALFLSLVILILFHKRFKKKRATVKLQREELFEKVNLLRTEFEKENDVITAFRGEIVSYSQLKKLVENLSASLSVEETTHTLCREVTDLLGRQNTIVILYLLEAQTGELAIVYSSRQHRPVHIKQKRGDVFDRWVMKMLTPLLLEDARRDFRFDMDKIDGEEGRVIESLLSVPLIVGNKPLGILRLDNPEPRSFTHKDLRFLKTIADVSAVALENAQLYDKVEDLAIRDSLTGLYLRRYLMERMDEETKRHLRRDKEMSFVMIDLDHFKRYNDNFGHPAGDIVLKSIAALMQKHFSSPGNLLCRYGGEEFCVLLSECDKEEARDLARVFVEAVAAEKILLRREETRVTVSAGVASFPADAKTREDLIVKADKALYEAKHRGRNRVQCA
ncbi:MAG: sensor domain-containing diguanylate cyclase [Candidatus Omnitrophica bacterium]|nr:sensor domain-containing diguanylate cyclase [Candidatus Omnitrophota bacterium]